MKSTRRTDGQDTGVGDEDLRAGELHLDAVQRPVAGDRGRRGERKTMVAVADAGVDQVLAELVGGVFR